MWRAVSQVGFPTSVPFEPEPHVLFVQTCPFWPELQERALDLRMDDLPFGSIQHSTFLQRYIRGLEVFFLRFISSSTLRHHEATLAHSLVL